MTEWQPIETAPKDGTTILICVRGSVFTASHVSFDGWWDLNKSDWEARVEHYGNSLHNALRNFRPYWTLGNDTVLDDEHFPPTHWMPLPDPPKE